MKISLYYTIMEQQNKETAASRISVLDSLSLDSAIYEILKNQLHSLINLISTGSATTYEPEINAFLKTMLWMLSVERTLATFGQQMLRLRYEGATPSYKLHILGLLQIGSSYLSDRMFHILSLIKYHNHTYACHLARIVEKIELLMKFINFVSFIIFLRRGGPTTFFEIILKLRPVSTVMPHERNLGYSFITRELLWHGLIELLTLIVPLINYHQIKSFLQSFGKKKSTKTYEPSSLVLPTFSVETKCPICNNFPILPHTMGCSHIFCRYCLAAHRLANPRFECPHCGHSNPDSSAVVALEASDS